MHLLVFPLVLFMLSVLGIVINRSNIILILICVELMLLSISFFFLVHALLTEGILGQAIALWVITVAAVESAIGLSIMIAFYRLKGSISIRYLNLLRG